MQRHFTFFFFVCLPIFNGFTVTPSTGFRLAAVSHVNLTYNFFFETITYILHSTAISHYADNTNFFSFFVRGYADILTSTTHALE